MIRKFGRPITATGYSGDLSEARYLPLYPAGKPVAAPDRKELSRCSLSRLASGWAE
jgi:hypothetical protein